MCRITCACVLIILHNINQNQNKISANDRAAAAIYVKKISISILEVAIESLTGAAVSFCESV